MFQKPSKTNDILFYSITKDPDHQRRFIAATRLHSSLASFSALTEEELEILYEVTAVSVEAALLGERGTGPKIEAISVLCQASHLHFPVGQRY
ncbi:hypothetical protein PHYPO_G00103360 [Pangasianodon hypophthalmus]|uniref:Uncharacterized protein n=1 Tax=Pangasianodon hypophthalmus TaxID=310915 RepID=A0A5N5PWU3_PANHP|nr:hypothetical protein PHYPO_G00103360 [Pangasianodon hypophthalmus]